MDITVEALASYYNEQLLNGMFDGRVSGERSDNTQSRLLYANIHAFFVHIGAARDYLAKFIALRNHNISNKCDSMVKLVRSLSVESFPDDAMLKFLLDSKCIIRSSSGKGDFEFSGWLKDLSSLRNKFIHREPFGTRSSEMFGSVKPASLEDNTMRYFRNVEIEGQDEVDVLDLVARIYTFGSYLFHEMARLSGLNSSVQTLTDKDLVSLRIS